MILINKSVIHLDLKNHFLPISPSLLRKQHCSRQRGITLIELLVTVSLLTLVTSFVVPSYSRFIARQQVQNTANQIRQFFTAGKHWVVKNQIPLFICASSDALSCDSDWNGELLMVADNNYSGFFEVETDTILQRQTLSAKKLIIQPKRNLNYYRLRKTGALKILGESIHICDSQFQDIGSRVVLWRIGRYRVSNTDSKGGPVNCRNDNP